MWPPHLAAIATIPVTRDWTAVPLPLTAGHSSGWFRPPVPVPCSPLVLPPYFVNSPNPACSVRCQKSPAHGHLTQCYHFAAEEAGEGRGRTAPGTGQFSAAQGSVWGGRSAGKGRQPGHGSGVCAAVGIRGHSPDCHPGCRLSPTDPREKSPSAERVNSGKRSPDAARRHLQRDEVNAPGRLQPGCPSVPQLPGTWQRPRQQGRRAGTRS